MINIKIKENRNQEVYQNIRKNIINSDKEKKFFTNNKNLFNFKLTHNENSLNYLFGFFIEIRGGKIQFLYTL